MKRLCFLWAMCLSLVSLFAQGDYLNQRADQYNKLPYTSEDIIFIGNSITHFGEWQEYFPDQRVKNRGIASNRADMVLDRLAPILKGKPKAIFVKIGVNDLSDGSYTPASLIANYELIIERIKKESPTTRIFMQSVLPINKPSTIESERAIPTNAAMKEICERTGATYVDLWPHFTVSSTNNQLKPSWSNDMVHLMGVGYAKWAELTADMVGSKLGIKNPTTDYVPISGATAYVNQRTSLFELITSETDDDIFMFGDDAVWAGLWDELLQSKSVKNRGLNATPGLGSDISYLNKSVQKWLDSHPKQFWIYAGSNDLFNYGKDQNFVVTQIGEVVKTVKAKSPTTEIFVQSLLPRNNATESQTVVNTNSALKAYCDATEGVTYVDIHSAFKNGGDNSINSTFTTNGLAINTLGYMNWCKVIAPLMGAGVAPLQPGSNLNAAYYNTSIVSTAANPVWFFIMAQGVNKKIIEQATTGTAVNCTAIPLPTNSLSQFWRVEATDNGKYYVINKGSNQYLTAEGSISETPTALSLTDMGAGSITIGDDTRFIFENGTALSNRTTDSDGASRFIFVKAPIGGEATPTWYQFKNERGLGGTLTLTSDYLNYTANTASPVFSDPNRFFRLKWDATATAFFMTPMTQPEKFVPAIAQDAYFGATSTISNSNPLSLVITPFATGKCAVFKKGTLNAGNGLRFDFSQLGVGLFDRALDNTNGRYDFLEYEATAPATVYPLNIEGKYAIQYKGLYTNTKISWFAGNTLIDNRTDISGKIQLVGNYSARYALWDIKKEEDGKYSIRNNRAGTIAQGGDYMASTGAVRPTLSFASANVDSKTFALYMDTETFDPTSSRIAIKSIGAGTFLYPVSAKNNTNEALTLSSAVSGTNACLFQFYPVVNNDALAAKINEANTLYSTTQGGTNDGQYPVAARTAFYAAIQKANVTLNKLTATEEEVTTATTEVTDAIAEYNSSKIITGLNEFGHLFRVWVSDGHLICNLKEAKMKVYDVSGIEHDAAKRLAEGIYFVQAYGKTFKVVVR